MHNLKQNLLSAGMTEEEIVVFFAMLEPDRETVLKIAQHTSIPRTTVYILIDSLLKKGLIQEVSEGKKKHYYPSSPQKIVEYVSQRKDQISTVLNQVQKNIHEIQALFNFYHEKPRITYYEGTNSILQLFESTLKEGEICMHFMSEMGSEILSHELEAYRQKIRESMVTTREIISDSLTDLHYIKTYANARNQVKYLPRAYATNVDYILYDGGYIQITYKAGKGMAICIEDKHISQFEKVRFNLIWGNPLLKEDNK